MSHFGIKIALKPVLPLDIGDKIQEIVRKKNHEILRNELLEKVYKRQISILISLHNLTFYDITSFEKFKKFIKKIFGFIPEFLNVDITNLLWQERLILSSVLFWEYYTYRNYCFPNEVGCNCCYGGIPTFSLNGVKICEKKWSKNQICKCNVDLINGMFCICDVPYRRQSLDPNEMFDKNEQDYDFFKKNY